MEFPRILTTMAMVAALSAGCVSQTVRNASGQQVSCVGVSCQHSLYNCEAGFEVCSGDELASAVRTLDKHGFWALARAYDAGPAAIVLDGGSTEVYVVFADGTTRRSATSQCSQRTICAILSEYYRNGWIGEDMPNCHPNRSELVGDCVVVGTRCPYSEELLNIEHGDESCE